jgi:ribosomal protein L37E
MAATVDENTAKPKKSISARATAANSTHKIPAELRQQTQLSRDTNGPPRPRQTTKFVENFAKTDERWRVLLAHSLFSQGQAVAMMGSRAQEQSGLKWKRSSSPWPPSRSLDSLLHLTCRVVRSIRRRCLSIDHKIQFRFLCLACSSTVAVTVAQKGTPSQGPRHNHTHTLCVRCGRKVSKTLNNLFVCAFCSCPVAQPAAHLRRCFVCADFPLADSDVRLVQLPARCHAQM